MNTHAGEVGILNVGAGDTKLTFDRSNPADCIRAARIVKDMLRRGYALLVENPPGSGIHKRALDFDETHCEYVIADFDPLAAAEHDAQEQPHAAEVTPQHQEGSSSTAPQPPTPKRRGRPPGSGRKRVDAAGAKAVAVPRVSGG
jgi:hypothetical protein